MANKIFTELNAKVFLELTEGEASALEAICGYGPEEFKQWFYRTCGKAYLQPHEKHIDSLFQKARSLASDVRKIKDIRSKLLEIENVVLQPKLNP